MSDRNVWVAVKPCIIIGTAARIARPRESAGSSDCTTRRLLKTLSSNTHTHRTPFMTHTDTRSTRIAVFIDFDNVEIGVKSTIGGQFRSEEHTSELQSPA